MANITTTEYEAVVDATWRVATDGNLEELIYSALGVAGEGGEVADTVKKMLRGGWAYDEKFRLAIAEELGDVLYYVTRVAKCLGYDLTDIMYQSKRKVESR